MTGAAQRACPAARSAIEATKPIRESWDGDTATGDAAAAFSTLDRNRDRKLSRAELGEHDPKLFERVDADKDGMLTFQEVMRHKIEGFEAADTNKDGALGFEEMIAGATKELEGSR